ncbi:hypothetical protein KMZ32_16390 [Phycicoccus sp. MAQZ13P-2]|uniref:hypothetical protein n=1 Tax=Phycicoccus mangrovi TaxID=2840470 RepID=UPI001C0057A7|nr:hypothetical protein [Phycicoccus mangrovi]MBT9257467.1 hypothetical protein [Phycicoccus mangrovi]MBT9275659.1 hypothetical protein [Phycicoccus mangrovi]
MVTGQAPVERDNCEPRDLVLTEPDTPGDIVSRELPLAGAATDDSELDQRLGGWTKVLLHPAA